jgi:hypothetical protein
MDDPWLLCLRGRPITNGELEGRRLEIPVGVGSAVSDVPGPRGPPSWASVIRDGFVEEVETHDGSEPGAIPEFRCLSRLEVDWRTRKYTE